MINYRKDRTAELDIDESGILFLDSKYYGANGEFTSPESVYFNGGDGYRGQGYTERVVGTKK